MKIYLLSFFMLIFLTGCHSYNNMEINELQIYLNDYINVNGNKLLEYLENDITLTEREKQIYLSRHRSMLQLLNSLNKNGDEK